MYIIPLADLVGYTKKKDKKLRWAYAKGMLGKVQEGNWKTDIIICHYKTFQNKITVKTKTLNNQKRLKSPTKISM